MEFNKKLQELRKQKGLTQEELSEKLYVSRTAISKWESGRGYPNIDSLKAIAKLFSVTVDELLSTDEMLTIAEEDSKRKEKHFCDVIYGLLDICIAMLLFLPFFAEDADGIIRSVSLIALGSVQNYLKIAYLVVVIAMIVMGGDNTRTTKHSNNGLGKKQNDDFAHTRGNLGNAAYDKFTAVCHRVCVRIISN